MKDNFNKYWREWQVLSSPKFDFKKMRDEGGWSVHAIDKSMNGPSTIAVKGKYTIRVNYSNPSGVSSIEVKENVIVKIYQVFNYIVKPNTAFLSDVLKKVGITNWRDYITDH